MLVVRHPVLAVEHDDPAAEPDLTQGLGGHRARRTGAHDDEHPLVCGWLRGGGFNGRKRHLDAVAIALDRVARQIVHRRRFEQRAGAQAERGLVPGTDDAIAVADALGQRRAGVRAGRTDSVNGFAVAEQEDLVSFDLNGMDLAVSQIVHRGGVVLRHSYPLRFITSSDEWRTTGVRTHARL